MPVVSTLRRVSFALLLPVASYMTGCGDAPEPATVPETALVGGNAIAPTALSAPAAVGAVRIVPQGPDTAHACAAGSVWVGTVRGRVLDLADAPLADEHVSLCGSFCVGGVTRADGRFTVRADACFPRTVDYPHAVAFEFHGLGYHAGLTVDLNPADASDLDAVEVQTLRAPSMLESSWVPVPHQGEGDQKLTLPDGFALDVAPGSLTLPFDALERVSATRVVGAQLPPFDARGAAPASMFALTPAEGVFAAPALLVLPNDQGLAPGAVVEIVMIGGPSTARFAPVGALGVVDRGRVAADGRTVAADHGIPFLGWVGYRASAN
jgi:hypothetical protein